MSGDPHPADVALATRSATTIAADEKVGLRRVVADNDEVRNTDFSAQYEIFVRATQHNYRLDTGSILPDDDNDVLIDAAGNHFLREPNSIGDTGAVDNAILRADGVDGDQLQTSVVIIDDSGNVYLVTSDSGALGSATKKWADLFLDSGAVINFNNGDVTLTHSSNDLALAGGTFTLPNAGLHILDTDATHDLIFVPGSNLTADRTFSLVTGDADRTLTMTGDHTLVAGTSAVIAGGQTLTGGFNATAFSAGTKSTGTFTPDPANGNFQYAVNGGAHTLAPPASDCTIVIQYTNNGSAGTITTSGFTFVTGDTITTTNGDDFLLFITRCNGFSHLQKQKLQ